MSAGDRALGATALYAGLRRGELQALRWSDVDLEAGLLRVERSWDQREGPVEPKSRAGRRRVPLVRPLRTELAAQRLRRGGGGEGLVLGRGERPFAPGAATRRARKAWSEGGLEPIGLHGGHLMPGSEAEAAGLLEAYLEREATQGVVVPGDHHRPLFYRLEQAVATDPHPLTPSPAEPPPDQEPSGIRGAKRIAHHEC